MASAPMSDIETSYGCQARGICCDGFSVLNRPNWHCRWCGRAYVRRERPSPFLPCPSCGARTNFPHCRACGARVAPIQRRWWQRLLGIANGKE